MSDVAPSQPPIRVLRTYSLAIVRMMIFVTLMPSSMYWTIVSGAVMFRYLSSIILDCVVRRTPYRN